MRSKVGEDGLRTILAKVEVPIGRDQIAMYAMSHPSLKEYANPMHGIEKLNKRQVFVLAKDSIREFGVHIPYEIVEDRWEPEHVERVKKHMIDLFPECD